MLTDNERHLITLIRDLTTAFGIPPTDAEIADIIEVSQQCVGKRIGTMIRKGYLARKAGVHRSLEITLVGRTAYDELD